MSKKTNEYFLEQIKKLLKSAHIPKSKMLLDLNLNKNTFVDWVKYGNLPSGDTLKKIADYFHVSVDFLLGNEQKEKPHTDNDVKLKDYELDVINTLRAAPLEVKKAVLRSLDIEFDESEL